MGQYVNDGKIDLGSQYDLDDAVAEIGDLLGVGARTSGTYAGKRVMADLFVASGINMFSKHKPFRYSVAIIDPAQREDILKANLYGLTLSNITIANNSRVESVSYVYASRTQYRIRDFDGYDHNAENGIEIENADGYSWTDSIVFKTKEVGESSIALKDILDYQVFERFESFAIVVINPFGFKRTIRSFASKDAFYAYLTGSNFTSYNLYNTHISNSAYTNLYYSPGGGSKEWYIGFAGVDKQAIVGLSRTTLLSHIQFTDNRIAPSMEIGVEGFTANMLVGTAYQGAAVPADGSAFGDTISISCCLDDALFLGVRINNRTTSAVTWDEKIKVLLLVGSKYYVLPLIRYAPTGLTLQALGVEGTLDGGDGNDWSYGMVYVGLYSVLAYFYALTQTDVVSGRIALIEGIITPPKLLTPWMEIELYNTQETLKNITPKATMPSTVNKGSITAL